MSSEEPISKKRKLPTPDPESVTCCVCLDVYHNPVILHCKHSLCEGCWLSLRSTKCPLCRQDFRLSKVSRAPADHFPQLEVVEVDMACGTSVVANTRNDHVRECLTCASSALDHHGEIECSQRELIEKHDRTIRMLVHRLSDLNKRVSVNVGGGVGIYDYMRRFPAQQKLVINSRSV